VLLRLQQQQLMLVVSLTLQLLLLLNLLHDFLLLQLIVGSFRRQRLRGLRHQLLRQFARQADLPGPAARCNGRLRHAGTNCSTRGALLAVAPHVARGA
jgi:hypothetical protein